MTCSKCGNSWCQGYCTTVPLFPAIHPTWPTPNMGWQCPKCGRGNAPFVATCPCGPTPPSYISTAMNAKT